MFINILCYCTDCYSGVAQYGVLEIKLVRNIPYVDFLLYLIFFFSVLPGFRIFLMVAALLC